MAVTKEFMEAVQSGKQMRVRIMLKDSLLVDPTAVQFEEMERYASQHMGDIYAAHDGEKLDFDVTAWTKDYLNQQMVAAVNNFSKERVDLLKSMVRYLYKEKADKIRSDRDAVGKRLAITQKQVGMGVTTAGAIVAVASVCTSHPMLAVGGAVVAAAGIVLIVSDKGNG